MASKPSNSDKADLIGAKFGKLTIAGFGKIGSRTSAICSCDCGGEIERRFSDIRRGFVSSCGCVSPLEKAMSAVFIPAEKIIGLRIGRLLIVEDADKTGNSEFFTAICDCGNTTTIKRKAISSKAKKSCGCLRKEKASERNFIDITGNVYGRLTVIRRSYVSEHKKVKWLCLCSCGSERDIEGASLRSGRTLSCGCLQREVAGQYRAENKMSPEQKDKSIRECRKRVQAKIKEDPVRSMAKRISRLHRHALSAVSAIKTSATFDELGYTPDQLVKHLENNFVDGMGWHNMKDWQIDHILPISLAMNREDVIELNQLSNLQPLWAKLNNAKRNKF